MLIDYQKANIYQKDDILVLKEVDFHVDEGEFIYIIGRVGAGKSTLLKTLYFELDVDEAENATVLNHDLRTLKKKHIPALRKQMGIIFQDFQLLSDRSVRDNLRFVLKATGWNDKNEMDERIDDVLGDVDMQDKGDRFPHELSGGEQQRVAIARAILNKPKIIIADEPTGNLDPETGQRIVSLLYKICKEQHSTVIMSTHNLAFLNNFPGRVIHLTDNQLVEVGGTDIEQQHTETGSHRDGCILAPRRVSPHRNHLCFTLRQLAHEVIGKTVKVPFRYPERVFVAEFLLQKNFFFFHFYLIFTYL